MLAPGAVQLGITPPAAVAAPTQVSPVRPLRHRGLAARLSGLSAVVLLVGLAAPASATGDYGPDTCLEGWVWREATPSDHVCVTSAVRTQTAFDNSQAAVRRSPTGGASGPDTCLIGYVWREAVAGDHVCVNTATRSQAAADNSQAAARRDSLNISITTYVTPNPCDGNDCSTTPDFPAFRLQGNHINAGAVLVELRRSNDNALTRNWNIQAYPFFGVPFLGGSFSLDTDVIDCARGYDSYFRVRDPLSGRWSTPQQVSAICAVY